MSYLVEQPPYCDLLRLSLSTRRFVRFADGQHLRLCRQDERDVGYPNTLHVVCKGMNEVAKIDCWSVHIACLVCEREGCMAIVNGRLSTRFLPTVTVEV